MTNHKLVVGESFPGLSFPQYDAGEYLYYDAGHELRLFWSSPNPREIQSVQSGEAEFGLLYEEDLICLAYRFGAEPANEAIYSWHLVPQARRQYPPETGIENDRALLTVVLTDAATGIIQVLRAVTLGPDFTRRLHGYLQEQARGFSIGTHEYFQRSRRIQAKYPTSDALMAATMVKTLGGE